MLNLNYYSNQNDDLPHLCCSFHQGGVLPSRLKCVKFYYSVVESEVQTTFEYTSEGHGCVSNR